MARHYGLGVFKRSATQIFASRLTRSLSLFDSFDGINNGGRCQPVLLQQAIRVATFRVAVADVDIFDRHRLVKRCDCGNRCSQSAGCEMFFGDDQLPVLPEWEEDIQQLEDIIEARESEAGDSGEAVEQAEEN